MTSRQQRAVDGGAQQSGGANQNDLQGHMRRTGRTQPGCANPANIGESGQNRQERRATKAPPRR
jgi:hypothetical protein